MHKEIDIDIGALIRHRLKENGQSVSWLARKVFQDRSNFNRKLKNNHIDIQLLMRISRVLNVDYFVKLSEEYQKTKTQES